MKEKFKNAAVKNFREGYSCSEAILKAAYDLDIVPQELISVATSFSGGMSSRCVCGAVAGAQMIIGYLHGKLKDNTARDLAKELYSRFTKIHKVACCKVLSAGFKDFHSPQRKEHCVNMVADASDIMYDILLEAEIKV